MTNRSSIRRAQVDSRRDFDRARRLLGKKQFDQISPQTIVATSGKP